MTQGMSGGGIRPKVLRKSYLYALGLQNEGIGMRCFFHAYLRKGNTKILSNDIWEKELCGEKWVDKNIKEGWEGVVYPLYLTSDNCNCKELVKWVTIATYFQQRAIELGMSDKECHEVVDNWEQYK